MQVRRFCIHMMLLMGVTCLQMGQSLSHCLMRCKDVRKDFRKCTCATLHPSDDSITEGEDDQGCSCSGRGTIKGCCLTLM